MDAEFRFEMQPLPQAQSKPLFVAGESAMAVDEAFLDGVYAGFNFQYLLNSNNQILQSPLPLLLEPPFNKDSYTTSSSDFLFVQGFPASETHHLKTEGQENFNLSNNVYNGIPPESFNFVQGFPASETHHLKTEVPESFNMCNGVYNGIPEFNFFSKTTSPVAAELVSMNSPTNSGIPASSSASYNKHDLNHRLGPQRNLETLSPSSMLARKRRQRISEKTRSLQKLLPWDKKMDTATMLEETYKYIQFLQAQVSVLQSMPSNSEQPSGFERGNGGTGTLYGGALWRLNRQQVLQVAVNSPAVQTFLYSKGCCICSEEQWSLLKKRALFHQVPFNSIPYALF